MALYTYPELPPAEEPSIEEMFADPMVQLVMARDGVSEREMQAAIARLQLKYADFPAA